MKDPYQALRQAAGLVERPGRARVRVLGKNRLDLLHRMTSQDLKSLPPGQGRTAVLLSDKGRVVDHLAVYALEDELRILSAREDASASLAHLKRYTMRDDFRPEDLTGATALLQVLGPRAAEALVAAGAREAMDLAPASAFGIRPLTGAGEFLLSIDGPCSLNLALWVPAERAPGWRSRLLEHGGALGLCEAGPEAYEVVRVESGFPAAGRELSDEVNPLEAGLNASIHWNKGCYIGQEVIARLDTYHKVQRHLVGLRLSAGAAPPAPGAEVLAGGEPAGRVTSAVHSPALGIAVALAYVRTKDAAEGTEVEVRAGDGTIRGQVASLPFVR